MADIVRRERRRRLDHDSSVQFAAGAGDAVRHVSGDAAVPVLLA